MAKITAFIRTTKAKQSANVRFRLRDGRDFQCFHKSELTVLHEKWDAKEQIIKAKVLFEEPKRAAFNKAITARRDLIHSIYVRMGKDLTSEILEEEINKELHPEKYGTLKQSFFDMYEEFITNNAHGDWQRKHHRVVLRCLKRFEIYKKLKLELDVFNVLLLNDFVEYLKNEFEICTTKPEIFIEVPECRSIKPRGINTISGMLSNFRTFFIWCIKNGKTENQPFKHFKIENDVYGTPYYITVDERNAIYNYDFSEFPELEKQRDIFVFQCFIGCRVGDLYSLTKKNIINGAVEYIAKKTSDNKGDTVRVPLSTVASEILEKYKDIEGDKLLPFIAQQNYNYAIKNIFKKAGITRDVIILDTITRQSVIKPINEVASSHLARRTLIGNLINKYKDSNLVTPLSGHVGGSKALHRYFVIDEETKIEMIKSIE